MWIHTLFAVTVCARAGGASRWCASETSSANALMTNKIIKSNDDHDARVFGVEAGAPDGDQCKGSAVTVATAKLSAISDTCVAVLASAAAALSFVATAMMN